MSSLRTTRKRVQLLFLLFLTGVALSVEAGRHAGLTERQALRLLQESGESPWNSLRVLLESHSPTTGPTIIDPPTRGIALPAGYTATNTGGRLIFAQVGDGDIPGTNQYLQAMFLLVNDSPNAAAGTLQFFNDSGLPMNMTIGGVTAASFPVSLKSGEVKRLTTSGRGSVRSGWAYVTTDQPITGVCSFSLRNASGQVLADVGVGEATLSTELRIFADTKNGANTGIALINPDPAVAVTLQVDLLNLAGTVVSSKTLPLAARGHVAQYLNELFPQAAGIASFEGTLVIRGAHKFGGVALRTVGALLTSIPTVPGLRFGDSRTKLIFPQVANGTAGGLSIKTTFIIINNAPQPTSGTLYFVKPDGTPMTLSIGGQNRSSVSYSLAPGAAQRVVTSGSGALATGWAWASMDRPISGTAIFHIYDSAARLVTEMGVLSSPSNASVDAAVDTIGSGRTAIALVNPSDEDTAAVTLSLLDEKGESKGQQQLDLLPRQYRSMFVDELFSTVPGVTEMQGRLMISGDAVATLTLRQTGVITTSVPWVYPSHGFTPACVVEFPELLTGTTPLVRLRIDQNPMDFTVHSLRLEAPGLPFEMAQIKPGDEIGYGIYFMKFNGNVNIIGGLVKMVATGSGSVLFDLIGSGPSMTPGTVLGSGKLDQTAAGGLVLELNSSQPTSCGEWNNGYGIELDLMLKAGILRTPAAAGQIEIVTTYSSSSAKKEEDDVRVARTSSQKVTFSAPGASQPRAVSQRPAFFCPGGPLVLSGGNWGVNPKVFFSNTSGGESAAMLLSATSDSLQVAVPTDAKEGNLRIVQGANSGNNLVSRTHFRPEVSVTKTAGQAGTLSLGFTVKQAGRQLNFQTADLRFYSLLWQTTGLAADTQVGTAVVKGGMSASEQTDYLVFVTAASSTEVELRVARHATATPVWLLRLTKEGSQDKPATRISLTPQTLVETPSVSAFACEMQIALPGVSFVAAKQQPAYYWMADIFSSPADLQGSDTGIRVNLGLKRLP